MMVVVVVVMVKLIFVVRGDFFVVFVDFNLYVCWISLQVLVSIWQV